MSRRHVSSKTLTHCLIWPCIACAAVFAAAQDTQPSVTTGPNADLDALLKEVTASPLIKAPLRTPDGKPLDESQSGQVQKAEGLLAEAEAARQKGEFDSAAEKAGMAAQMFRSILGMGDFRSVAARVTTETMGLWSNSSESDRAKLVVADEKRRRARSLYDQGEYAQAAEAAGAALEVFKALKSGDAAMSEALLELGRAQTELSLLDDADKTLAEALGLAKRAYGANRPQTALVLDRIGWLRFNQARRASGNVRELLEQGVESLEESTRIMLSTVGEDADYAEALDNLGTVWLLSRRLDEALKAKLRALFVRQQVLGPEHKDVAVSLTNIARILENQGALDAALAHQRKAAEIFEKSLGLEHPYTLLGKANLARLLLFEGRKEEAVPLIDDLARVNDRQASDLTSDVLNRATNLTVAYFAADQLEKGLRMVTRVIELAHRLYADGKQQPAHLNLLELGKDCDRYRLVEVAAKVFEQVVAWDEAARKAGDEDDLEMIMRATHLAGLRIDLGQLAEAEQILTQIIQRTERLVGRDTVELLAPLMYLADLHERRKEYQKAESYCERALQISEAKWSRSAPATAHAMLLLGRLYVLQDQFDMAQFTLDEADSAFQKLGRPDRVGVVRLLCEQGRLLAAMGKRDEAIERLKQALEQARVWTGPERTPKGMAETASVLKRLLETVDSGDAAHKNELATWRAELKSILGELKSRRAITAQEKQWLGEIGG